MNPSATNHQQGRRRHARSPFAALVFLICLTGLLDGSRAVAASNAVAEVLAELFDSLQAQSNKISQVSTSSPNPALLDSRKRIATTNLLDENRLAKTPVDWEDQLQRARQMRLNHAAVEAARELVKLINSEAPEPLKRTALIELALTAEDQKDEARALQIFNQFVARWPDDSSVPEIHLREGLLYRQMGLNNLALTKFYATMSGALVLKVDNFQYYRRLVLQAQTEIAETYYQQGKHKDAVEYLRRLLKSDDVSLNRSQVVFKLVRSMSCLGQHEDVLAQGRAYLDRHTNAPETAEVRFLMAGSMKQLGRNSEALQQIMELLREQEKNAVNRPEVWSFWQRRAGNVIANQLFQEGDFVHAVQLYESIVPLDPALQWQLPVLYQAGLSYEHLEQPQKADAIYGQILAREKELGTNAPPVLLNVISMSRWRRNLLGWQNRTAEAAQRFRASVIGMTNELAIAPSPAVTPPTAN